MAEARGMLKPDWMKLESYTSGSDQGAHSGCYLLIHLPSHSSVLHLTLRRETRQVPTHVVGANYCQRSRSDLLMITGGLHQEEDTGRRHTLPPYRE